MPPAPPMALAPLIRLGAGHIERHAAPMCPMHDAVTGAQTLSTRVWETALPTGKRSQSSGCYESAALDQAPRPGDLTYRLPLPPSGPQWTVHGPPGPVGRVIGLITTFAPVWIGTEPRLDLVVVTTTLPPTWIFPGLPPADAASAVRATDARAANKISDFRMIDLPISLGAGMRVGLFATLVYRAA